MSVPAPPPRAIRDTFDRGDDTPRATERTYGTGVYRRRILVRLDGRRAWGELEDDFHHFHVAITHNGKEVESVEGSGVRSPWTMCLTAGTPLEALVGTALMTGPGALGHLDARQNCTHMFDLAGLVVTHAARGVDGDRLYDMEVADSAAPDGERTPRLWRDGELVLDWRVKGRTVLGPSEWRDAPLWNRFIPWAQENLEGELAEAAVALRRTIDISQGRLRDLDGLETAEELMGVMAGTCHAFQPENAPLAIRRKGSGRDFTDHPELLLADFDTRT